MTNTRQTCCFCSKFPMTEIWLASMSLADVGEVVERRSVDIGTDCCIISNQLSVLSSNNPKNTVIVECSC